MRRVPGLLLACFVLGVPMLRAQKSADEAAIRAVLARENVGWQTFDPKMVASSFTEDAVWQNPFGVRIHGRVAMERFLTDLMARPGFRAGTSTVPAKVLEVRITSPTTATVWSDEKIEGLVNDMSGKPMDPRHSYYLDVLVKRDGVWKICDGIVMDLVHLR